MIYSIIGACGDVYALWVFYLAVMALMRARDAGTLSRPALVLGYPILALGYLLDFLVNFFILTWILLEVPRELVVTARLSRHRTNGPGWRYNVCTWICSNLLDAFDPGGCHCSKPHD